MSQRIQKYGPLRKKWEHSLGQKWFRWASISEVARDAGITAQQLTKAINDGVGSDSLRNALVSIGVDEHLIPLPSCTRVLAGMYFEAQEKLGRCQKI